MENVLGMRDMAVPVFAGILSAFRRVIARRISIKVNLFHFYAAFICTGIAFIHALLQPLSIVLRISLKGAFTPLPLLLLHASCFLSPCGTLYW